MGKMKSCLLVMMRWMYRWNEFGALVEQLEEGMLTICAWFAKDDSS
jgi:hypothetical protein